MRLFLIAAVLLIALPRYSEAAEFGKASVYVASVAKDSVGGRMVYAIRETIRRSSVMEVVPNSSGAAYVIHLVTLEPDQSANGAPSMSTVYSVVWTVQFRPGVLTYWSHSVGTCGSARVTECGEGLAADTERVISEVRAVLSEE